MASKKAASDLLERVRSSCAARVQQFSTEASKFGVDVDDERLREFADALPLGTTTKSRASRRAPADAPRARTAPGPVRVRRRRARLHGGRLRVLVRATPQRAHSPHTPVLS